MTTPVLLGVLLACLVCEGFFSGSEIAVVSADRLNLRTEAEKGGRGAALALRLLERPTWLLGTCLIGTNLATITGATVSAVLVARHLGLPEAAAVVFFWPLTLTFGELVPKAVYQHHADRLAPVVVFPLRVLSLLFSPALLVFDGLARLLGAGQGPGQPTATREEIRLLLEDSAEGGSELRPADQALIQRVFQFTESVVEDAMKPLIEVVAVSSTTTVAQVARRMAISGHSRLPVYRDRIDQIVGLVLHQDVLAADDWSQPVSTVMRPCMFVPELKRVDELLVEMRRQRSHMAVAVDEYGGAVGIITIEDLLEEIVGEIEDEHDVEEGPKLVPADDGTLLADARATIEEFESRVGPVLNDEEREEIDTLGGLVFALAGRVPGRGELVFHPSGLEFEVLEADPRRVKRVRVRNLPKPADAA